MDYIISVLTFAVIWGILVMSLNVLLGYGGQVSLGHAAFFGIGSYSAAILATRYDIPFLGTILGAMLITAFIGGLLGLPSLRVRHDFLVLVTIGLNFIVVGTLGYVDFFGGALGIVGIPVPAVLGYKLKGEVYLAFCTAMMLASAWFSWYIPKTWGGLGLFALRDDETAAEAVGVSHARYKITAFALSGALAGLGGSLYAPFVGNVFPDRFGFIESVTLVSMLVFGGIGTVRGAIFGGVVLKTLPEYLRFGGEYRFAIYGGILLVTILFMPQGVLGDGSPIWKMLVAAWKRIWRRTDAPSDGAGPTSSNQQTAVSHSETMLEVSDVTVDFGGLRALDSVSLQVHAGEVLGLIGPNGAGKTTLFNAISGLVKITEGTIKVNGKEIQGLPSHEIARQSIARTFQIVRPFSSMDVQNNILSGMGAHIYPKPRAFAARKDLAVPHIQAIAQSIGLINRQHVISSQLPIGLLRRLEVGRALATQARFLLLDEPAAGLTHEEVEDLKGLVRDLAEGGHGVVLVEHNMRFAMQVCDRLVVLAAGKVLAEGKPQEVSQNEEVIAVYLGTDE